uniref:Uncharacterized protein n=1 Tax=Oryza meridionalis TaxID=40149 RepID=A0A0E0DT79_9ORYZ
MVSSRSDGSSSSSRRLAPVPYRVGPMEYQPPVFCRCKAKAARWTWSVDNPGWRMENEQMRQEVEECRERLGEDRQRLEETRVPELRHRQKHSLK